jgi:hypothetical protein
MNGRDTLSWEFDLDIWYVDNHNLALDLRIIRLTVLRLSLFRPQDINPVGAVTMPRFFASTSDSLTCRKHNAEPS